MFLGCSRQNPALIYDDTGGYFDNYYGSNTPYSDGIIISRNNTRNQVCANITYQIYGEFERFNLSELKVLEKFSFNCELKFYNNEMDYYSIIPTFFIDITSQNHKAKVNTAAETYLYDTTSSALLIGTLQNTFRITPVKSGNDTIIIGSNFQKPLLTFNITTLYFEMKNYTLNTDLKESITYNDDLNLTIEVEYENNAPVDDSVEIKIDDDYFNNVTIVNGTGNIIINKLNAGRHELNITYLDTSYLYNDISKIRYVNVSKADLNLTIKTADITRGEIETVHISNIPEDLTGNISVGISDFDKDSEVTAVNGSATYIFRNLNPGSKVVFVYYRGDDNYNTFNEMSFFNVLNPAIPQDSFDSEDIPDITDIVEEENSNDSDIYNIIEDITIDEFSFDESIISDMVEVFASESYDIVEYDTQNITDISTEEPAAYEENIPPTNSSYVEISRIVTATFIEESIQLANNSFKINNETLQGSVGDKADNEGKFSQESNDFKSDVENTYEINEKPTKEINNVNLIYIIAFILIAMGLTITGYFKQEK